MSKLVFVDTETTGLDLERHDLWEIALIEAEPYEDGSGLNVVGEHVIYVWPDPMMADPGALRVNRFYERAPNPWGKLREEDGGDGMWWQFDEAAELVARVTANAHIVGAVPWFDTQFLEKFLRTWDYVPAWHYHLIDIESLVAGVVKAKPPWKSTDLWSRIGVEQDEQSKHTAHGDAHTALEVYEKVMYGG